MAIMSWLKRENIFNTNYSAQTSLVNYHWNGPLMSERDKKFGRIVYDKLAFLGGDKASRFWFAMRDSVNSCVDGELNSFCVHFRDLGHCIIRMKN